ncbi:hypothetical protein EVAR_101739_1 [Eumeta japonica]|uniref:Uncharacterized protein n=1 Tax=Eumeta variegata TaxID=151549 RepID=A0A4C1SN48_EUMVA|nr:hypothetical protein EVAR_101739_1 [Eumeta japonica]
MRCGVTRAGGIKIRRNEESSSETENRLSIHRQYVAQSRARESSTERSQRLAEQNMRTAQIRARESSLQRSQRLAEQNHARASQVLSVCSGEEQNIRNIQSRTRESSSERFQRLQDQRTTTDVKRRSRNQVLAHSNRSAFRYDPQIDYAQQSSVQIGDMNKICPKCSAKNGSMKLMACAVLLEKNPNDEVENYVNGRYISTSEAAWRIFEFPIHERHPTVLQLAVHLEMAKGCILPQKRLYKWPKIHVESTVSILLNPVFLSWMLLHHVRGPTSFQYLKTVDGVLKETYQAACRARVRTESNAAETMTHRYDTNNLTAFVNENLPKLVPDQRHAFETIVDSVIHDKEKFSFGCTWWNRKDVSCKFDTC